MKDLQELLFSNLHSFCFLHLSSIYFVRLLIIIRLAVDYIMHLNMCIKYILQWVGWGRGHGFNLGCVTCKDYTIYVIHPALIIIYVVGKVTIYFWT